MKKQLLPFAGGVVAVLVFLEVLFRILPVSTATRSGYYIHPLIITYPAHHCFTIATGWDLRNSQNNCTNNYGFLADRDFVHDPQAIALIGDSFVEANMLPAQLRLGAQLQAKLPNQAVYAMGGPGSSLLDYAERATFAAENFGIRTFVFILERGDVKQSVCGSGNVHGPCIDAHTLRLKTELQPSANTLKRLVRNSALAQYVFSQLRFNISTAFSRLTNPTIPNKSLASRSHILQQKTSTSTTLKILDQFFVQLSAIEGSRFFFLVDADRHHLTDSPLPEPEDLKSFKEEAAARYSAIIDPREAFREFVAGSGRKLDVGPYDHHWNGSAVKIIADLIAKRLNESREN